GERPRSGQGGVLPARGSGDDRVGRRRRRRRRAAAKAAAKAPAKVAKAAATVAKAAATVAKAAATAADGYPSGSHGSPPAGYPWLSEGRPGPEAPAPDGLRQIIRPSWLRAAGCGTLSRE